MIALHRIEVTDGELRPAVRAALLRLLGVTGLQVDEHGRPWSPGVSFNVSHSGTLGVIALAEGDRRIGVDVEQVRADTDVRALARRFFHPDEAAAIAGRRDAFFRCWTRKEAVVKALGRGLSHPLDSFAVDVDADGPAEVAGVGGLLVRSLETPPGYVAALASDPPLRFRWANRRI